MKILIAIMMIFSLWSCDSSTKTGGTKPKTEANAKQIYYVTIECNKYQYATGYMPEKEIDTTREFSDSAAYRTGLQMFNIRKEAVHEMKSMAIDGMPPLLIPVKFTVENQQGENIKTKLSTSTIFAIESEEAKELDRKIKK